MNRLERRDFVPWDSNQPTVFSQTVTWLRANFCVDWNGHFGPYEEVPSFRDYFLFFEGSGRQIQGDGHVE